MSGKLWKHIATGKVNYITGLKQFTRWHYSKYYSSAGLVPTTAKSTRSGAVRPQPKQTKFGIFKVFLIVVPVVLFGASVSNKGAEFLEDSEIFVPDD